MYPPRRSMNVVTPTKFASSASTPKARRRQLVEADEERRVEVREVEPTASSCAGIVAAAPTKASSSQMPFCSTSGISPTANGRSNGASIPSGAADDVAEVAFEVHRVGVLVQAVEMSFDFHLAAVERRRW